MLFVCVRKRRMGIPSFLLVGERTGGVIGALIDDEGKGVDPCELHTSPSICTLDKTEVNVLFFYSEGINDGTLGHTII